MDKIVKSLAHALILQALSAFSLNEIVSVKTGVILCRKIKKMPFRMRVLIGIVSFLFDWAGFFYGGCLFSLQNGQQQQKMLHAVEQINWYPVKQFLKFYQKLSLYIYYYQRLRDALLLGLGIGILANTRPLEGLLFGIPLGCLVLPWKMKWQAVDKNRLLKNAVLPLMLFVMAIAILTGIYNKKITGHALVLPHVLYVKLYDQSPVFMWQPLNPIIDFNYKAWADMLRDKHISYYYHKRSWKGFIQCMSRDSGAMFMFYFGFLLALPALLIMRRLFTGRDTAGRSFIVFFILLLMLGALPVRANSYFFASLTCFAVLLVSMGLRRLWCINLRRQQVGGTLILFLIGLQLFLNIILTPVQPKVMSLARSIKSASVGLPASFTREELKNYLMKCAGRYLVIVHYPFMYNYHLEWVFNDADIDHAPIVWARDLGKEKDKRLLEYFKDRQVLYIDVYWSMKDVSNFEARQ